MRRGFLGSVAFTLVLIFVVNIRSLASEIASASSEICHELSGQEYCAVDNKCHPDGNCEGCDGRLTEDIDSHECIDRVVFSSHAAVDAVAAVIWFFGAGLAMSAGVGGGGIFVPLGVILLRFASKPSTGLSQASIFGASLAGFLINIRGRHPKADRPVIDMDMALFLAPMEMAGAMVGILVQKILPTWAVILLMAVILGYTAYKTFKKACSTFKKERAANRAAAKAELPEKEPAANRAEAKAELPEKAKVDSASGMDEVQKIDLQREETISIEPVSELKDDELQELPCEHCKVEAGKLELSPENSASKPRIAWAATLQLTPKNPATKPAPGLDSAYSGLSKLPSAEEWLEREKKVQVCSVLSLFLMWLTLIAFLVLKGGKGTKGVFKYCSAGYWLVTVVSFLWLCGFALLAGRRAVSRSIQKSAVGYPFVEGDVIWSWAKFRLYCFLTFSAGVVAGLIGIGGGMVLGPMMLQLGVLPQVSSATTATMIVMTSSAAAFMFITGGLVPMSYACAFFCVAFVGAYTGKLCIDKMVKKYKLTSIIVFILATIIAFASGMMTINGIIIYGDKDWEFEGLNDAC